jgi:exonuclease III
VFRRLNGRVRRLRGVENTSFKLWYTGKERSRNDVCILIDKSLKNEVVAVRIQGDMIIMIKLIFGDLVLNVISAYAPQVGLSDDVKRRFWKDLEDMIRGVPSNEKLFIEGDLIGHVGTVREEFERVHEGSGYDEQNQEGEGILNFAIAYDLMVANTFFKKKIAFNYFQQWPALEPNRFCPD